jgi:hypothetical protein
VLQTTLEAEMTEHLGYEKGRPGRPRHSPQRQLTETVQTEVAPSFVLVVDHSPFDYDDHARR